MDINNLSIEKKLELIKKKYPLVPHTNAGRLFSTVRRMKMEKEMEIPISMRSGFAISVKTRRRTNEMNKQEWEKFYSDLCKELKNSYPELYQNTFSNSKNSKGL